MEISRDLMQRLKRITFDEITYLKNQDSLSTRLFYFSFISEYAPCKIKIGCRKFSTTGFILQLTQRTVSFTVLSLNLSLKPFQAHRQCLCNTFNLG